jgi:hypothetical protein
VGKGFPFAAAQRFTCPIGHEATHLSAIKGTGVTQRSRTCHNTRDERTAPHDRTTRRLKSVGAAAPPHVISHLRANGLRSAFMAMRVASSEDGREPSCWRVLHRHLPSVHARKVESLLEASPPATHTSAAHAHERSTEERSSRQCARRTGRGERRGQCVWAVARCSTRVESSQVKSSRVKQLTRRGSPSNLRATSAIGRRRPDRRHRGVRWRA